MGNGGRYNLRKAGKRGVRGDEEEGSGSIADNDRLSHLPEPILCHILSFLDTKSAVQTSVLSRGWRSVWKCVPVLDLRGDSFRSYAAFKRFVHKVLFWRGHLSVHKVCYVDNVTVDSSGRRDESVITSVIEYALSHDVQQLVIDAGNQFTSSRDYCRFSSVFGSILNSNLKSLELGCVVLDSGFRSSSSAFPMLTSLNLKKCAAEDLDHISDFPYLTNLVIRDGFLPGPTMRVCGPQLLSLELHGMEDLEIEIFAPKLKSFRLRQWALSQGFSKLTLPLLDHADIALGMTNSMLSYIEVFQVLIRRQCCFLFQGLHNAKTLKLNADAIKILKMICVLPEQQPSPFRRLESLIVATDRVPVKVVNYLFNGSSCEEPDILIDLDR